MIFLIPVPPSTGSSPPPSFELFRLVWNDRTPIFAFAGSTLTAGGRTVGHQPTVRSTPGYHPVLLPMRLFVRLFLSYPLTGLTLTHWTCVWVRSISFPTQTLSQSFTLFAGATRAFYEQSDLPKLVCCYCIIPSCRLAQISIPYGYPVARFRSVKSPKTLTYWIFCFLRLIQSTAPVIGYSDDSTQHHSSSVTWSVSATVTRLSSQRPRISPGAEVPRFLPYPLQHFCCTAAIVCCMRHALSIRPTGRTTTGFH